MSEVSLENKTVGVVIAGGLSRRMEGPEKSLMLLKGQPIIKHVCDRLQDQLDDIILNANGNAARFAFLDIPVQHDTVDGFAGPLAGILAGMRWAQANRQTASRIITVAADTPFFPVNLVKLFDKHIAQLEMGAERSAICLAYSDNNRHPVFGSWPITLADKLEHFLTVENERKVMLFVQRFELIKVDFPLVEIDERSVDPFFNINTPADFTLAETLMPEMLP